MNIKTNKMKKLILPILLVIISSACSAQVTKTFVIRPAVTVVSDSLTFKIFDTGTEIIAKVKYENIGVSNLYDENTVFVTVWAGVDYANNIGYSKATLKNALKTILQNQLK